MAKRCRNVIIGNSIAGISALEAMRKEGFQGEIVIFSKDRLPAYTPTVLQYFIDGRVEEGRLGLREESFYLQQGAKLLLGTEVIEVKPGGYKVLLSDGKKMDFDQLLIATGTVPLVPPIEGLSGDRIFTLRTIEDAKRIKACCVKGDQVLVIGAGLIGLPLAGTFHRLGLKVTVVELFDQVLPRNLDNPSGQILRHIFEEKGIKIVTGSGVERVMERSGKLIARFSKGKDSMFDFIVIAAGVRASMDLVRDSGIVCRQGILVDDRMRTNNPMIYAAGDVAEAKDFLKGEHTLNPILPDAVEQGRVAGRNMAGQETRYAGGLNMNIFTFFGNMAFSAGQFNARGKEYEIFTFSLPDQRVYRKLIFKDHTLVGAIMINGGIDPGAIQSLILQKVDLRIWKKGLTAPHVLYENWLGWILKEKGVERRRVP